MSDELKTISSILANFSAWWTLKLKDQDFQHLTKEEKMNIGYKKLLELAENSNSNLDLNELKQLIMEESN